MTCMTTLLCHVTTRSRCPHTLLQHPDMPAYLPSPISQNHHSISACHSPCLVVFNARHLSVQFFTCKSKTTTRTISNMSYGYRLQLMSMFPISIRLHCNRIQYPILHSTLYMEYTCRPVPGVWSLLLSLVTLPSTHAYTCMACACRSPHCSYLKFQFQWNYDSATLWEKWLKPGPSHL